MLQLKDLKFAHASPTKARHEATQFDLTLTATKGEITAITGPSGAGKSTLFDLIGGFLQPQSGALEFDSQDLLPLAPAKRPVSILFQNNNLFDHLSVSKNLEFGFDAKLTSQERHQKIAAALEQVNLSGMENQKAEDLSGGQKQRVALARTLLRNRPIMLLDEPFAALDANIANKLRALIKQMTRENHWITLLISHDPTDEKIADKNYRFDEGKLFSLP